jgi:hypothetical protein
MIARPRWQNVGSDGPIATASDAAARQILARFYRA